MGKKERIKRLRKVRKEKIANKNQVIRAAFREEVIAEASSKLKSKISKDIEVRYNQGKIKYSEVLSEFVSPLLDEDITDLDTIKYLYTLGTMSWNRVVLNQKYASSKKLRDMDKLVNKLDPESRDRLQFLIDRKKQYYATHNVIYSDFEIVERNGEFGISTAVINMEEQV